MMFTSRFALTAVLFSAAGALSTSALAGAPDRDYGIRSEEVVFPVTLSDGGSYEIVGRYYHRGSTTNRPLQVLVHGASYDHRYWDAGTINGENYSYAEYMVAQGYSVLAIDQLGAGESSTPFGYSLTLDETASGLHQVLSSLRTTSNPIGGAFASIGLVGHSNGSVTAIREEATYHSADALVVTGWSHTYTPLALDPDFMVSLLATPYLSRTAFPEFLRAAMFFNPAQTDPDMLAYDCSTLASTMSAGQWYDLLIALTYPVYDGVSYVQGPVLVQLGEMDPIAPAANAALEPLYWLSAESVTVETLDDMGHDYNLHLNREDSWAGIANWLDEAL